VIRIAIADDHPVVREGLAAALEGESDLRIVGTAGSAGELLERAASWRPDVIVLDFEMPGLRGAQAIRAINDALPASRTVIFTAYAEDDKIVEAIRAGAAGYVLKGSPAAEVAHAIRLVNSGSSYVSADVAARLALRLHKPRNDTLTVREREVMRLIADGMSNKQVARRLGIAERTVKYHVSTAMMKLRADNRAQAVAAAVKKGLL
jgi:DNA-binding NarL/FixJ family response regulator